MQAGWALRDPLQRSILPTPVLPTGLSRCSGFPLATNLFAGVRERPDAFRFFLTREPQVLALRLAASGRVSRSTSTDAAWMPWASSCSPCAWQARTGRGPWPPPEPGARWSAPPPPGRPVQSDSRASPAICEESGGEFPTSPGEVLTRVGCETALYVLTPPLLLGDLAAGQWSMSHQAEPLAPKEVLCRRESHGQQGVQGRRGQEGAARGGKGKR